MSTTYVPYDVPLYHPTPMQTDDELRRLIECEILEQWYKLDSDELPPDLTDPHAHAEVAAWTPMSAAQRIALECPADIILYGGSAGSLKSETLLVNASIEVGNPNYNAIIFRQSFPELRDLVKKSIRLYTKLGGKFTKGSPLKWTFPSGATIWLGYMGHDDDVYAHQGAEYSFIGFDEGGHQTEPRLRYMLTRLRSPDQTLRKRMFITANPGGPGHSMLMHMFLKGVCPHCEPSRCVKSGELRYDATWKSDSQPLSVKLPGGREVRRSVAFIPGKITDHNLLGEEYIANLMTQAAATAKQLMDGCWKAWEGQYFDCFSEMRGINVLDGGKIEIPQPDMRMVVPRQEVEIKHWYPHIVGGDYGFAGSSAVALLLVRLPASPDFKNGRLYLLDEYCEKGVTAKDYGRKLIERWYLEDGKEPALSRAMQMWAVSPDAWRKDGSTNDQDVPFSRLEQMNEALREYGFEFIRANDDRKSGWMKMYQMLRDGELVIARHCVKSIEMLQTRIRDDKKLDDIKKVAGDELDDIADGLRYAVMTWQMQGVQPRAERIAEAIQGLDPTNTAMTIRKFEIEERRQEAPILVAPKMRRGGHGTAW